MLSRQEGARNVTSVQKQHEHNLPGRSTVASTNQHADIARLFGHTLLFSCLDEFRPEEVETYASMTSSLFFSCGHVFSFHF